MKISYLRRSIFIGLLALVVPSPFSTAGKEKMNWEELVAKHLDSIGTPEARSAAKTRAMNGTSEVFFRLGNTGRLSGQATVLSEGHMLRMGMHFGHREYSGEQLAFDGKDVTVGIIKAGVRSNLSQFIHDYSFLLKEGLLGGTTALGWCLYQVRERRAKIKYKGLKKIEGRELHELEYRPRKGAESFDIKLYFQPETFRHLLSTYHLRIPAYMAQRPEDSIKQRDSHYRVVEEFDGFREVDGLTLPHVYKLNLTYDSQHQTFLTEWNINISETTHNRQLNPDFFKIQ